MAQNWLNPDGLFQQYGTDKAIAETAGEFSFEGPNRIVEVLVDLTVLSTSSSAPTILSNTTIFPAPPSGQLYIESVEITAETAAASGTSFNIGLIQMDRATIPSGYGQGFIAAEVTATYATAGDYVKYTTGTSKAGSLIGTSPANATGPYYLTAYTTGTYTTGKLRVRISYHGVPPITQ